MQDLAIRWDLESCSLPKKANVGGIVQRARAIAGQHGRVVDFSAFLAHEQDSAECAAQKDAQSGRSWSTLPTFGVKLEYTRRHGQIEVVDRRIIVDIPFYLKEHPSTTFIVLITADGDFVSLLSRLAERGIGVAVISKNQAFERYQRSFDHVYHWTSDVTNKAGVPLPHTSAPSVANGSTIDAMEEDWGHEDGSFRMYGGEDGDYEDEDEGDDEVDDQGVACAGWGVGERTSSSRKLENKTFSSRDSDSSDSSSDSSDSDDEKPTQGIAKHPSNRASESRPTKPATSDSESSSSESSTKTPSPRGGSKPSKERSDSDSSGSETETKTMQKKTPRSLGSPKKAKQSSSPESSSSSESDSSSSSSGSDSDSSSSGTDDRKKAKCGQKKPAEGSDQTTKTKYMPAKSARKNDGGSSSSDSTDSSDSDSTESGSGIKPVKKVSLQPARKSSAPSSSDSSSSSESESESEKKTTVVRTNKAQQSCPTHRKTRSPDGDSSLDSSDDGEAVVPHRLDRKPSTQASPAKKPQKHWGKGDQDPMEVDEDRDYDAEPRNQDVKSYRDQATMTDVPGSGAFLVKREPKISSLRTHQAISKRVEDEDEEWGMMFTTTMWQRQRRSILGPGFKPRPLLKRGHPSPTALPSSRRVAKGRKVAKKSSDSSSDG